MRPQNTRWECFATKHFRERIYVVKCCTVTFDIFKCMVEVMFVFRSHDMHKQTVLGGGASMWT